MGGLAERYGAMYYVYILQSRKTGRHYIGSTQDVTKRLQEHNRGKMKSTKHGSPWEVMYTEAVGSRSQAFGREQQLKRYKSGEAVRRLIHGGIA